MVKCPGRTVVRRRARADEDAVSGQRYYSSFGNGFDNRFGGDTLTLSQIAYTLWRYQGRRDINRSYKNQMDYSTDFTVGGPLSENARIFLARQED